MRIAHVTDCYLPRMGGIERQVDGLSRIQAAHGHDVEVITSVPSGSGAERSSSVPVIGPSKQGSEPGSIRYLATLSGRRAVIEGGYDLVHVHASTFSPLSYLAAGAASRDGVPTVVTLHSLWSWATPIFRGFDLGLDWRRWPLTWTAVSEAAVQSLSGVLRAGTPISVLPNGVAPELWRPARLPRDPNRVVIVSVMRLAARKRPMHLLKMLRAVRAQVPPGVRVEAKIIGDGPKRESMLDYLRKHRMTDWVELTGQLDQPTIRRVFDDADLYISPATLESFGIAALEARCSGLPVVAFAGTGVSDFIVHERNGLLVSGDAEMAAALASLVRSTEARTALTEHNLATESGFSWASVLSTCEDVYADAFEQAGRVMPPIGPLADIATG
ncbi:MAG: glycosyltransferase family 4 protein [Actinomycetota bacterium]|nr:glycosyltransferase family 4 protein [Actinomycetota bacterium]MDQ2957793.1 glycosyltransferase family 4 protein [Actinomycetota bacterium]